MGLKGEVDQLFLANVESANIRYATQPVGAGIAAISDGAAAAWAWAAYVQIVAAAVIPNPCWLTGVWLGTSAVEIFYGDFAIASGAAAAEVDLALVTYGGMIATAATDAFDPNMAYYPLPFPIKIVGSPRLAVRLRKSTAASAAGATLKIQIATAVGT